jgi:hypothetical protein
MTKDVEKTENENENLPSKNPAHNAYEAWGAQASQRNIIGQLLKFNKGRWVTGGANNQLVEIKPGTRLIVNMASLTVGWQKWQDDRPVDSHMGLVSENYQPPLRRTLGDNKEDGGWEEDENGKERDPWQASNMVVLRQIGTSGETEGLYTFATSSRGGINAIGVLSKTYGRKIREDEEALPIVELGAGSYMHRIKSRGEIEFPVFNIIGWGTAADVEDASETVVEEVDEETGEVTETKTRTAPKKTEHAKARQATASTKPAPAKKTAAGKKKPRF